MAIALFYSATTGRLRSIVRDADKTFGEIMAIHPGRPGEDVLEMPSDDLPFRTEAQAYISKEVGLVPSSDRYAVVNRDTVVGVIIADPAIDSVPGHQLIPSDTAGSGWRKLADDSFVPGNAELDLVIARLDVQRNRLEGRSELSQEELARRLGEIDGRIAQLEKIKARI
jgi:hypothetical protein